MNRAAPNARRTPLPVGHQFAREEGPNPRRHKILEVLGEGGFGITYRGRMPSGEEVAIKEFFPSGHSERSHSCQVAPLPDSYAQFEAAKAFFEKEAETLRAMAPHPNVVGVRSHFTRHNTAYMVMDLVRGHSVHDYLVKMAEGQFDPTGEDVRQFLIGVASGLAHVHDAQILHGDIKPQNILIDEPDGRPILIDFGASREMKDAKQRPDFISLTFAAIELIHAGLHSAIGPWSDIYSLGVVAYMLATGTTPATAVARGDAVFNHGRPDPIRPCVSACRPGIDRDLAEIIDACLALDPSDRPQSADALAARLRHGPGRDQVTRIYGRARRLDEGQVRQALLVVIAPRSDPERPAPASPAPTPPPAPRQPPGPGEDGVGALELLLFLIVIVFLGLLTYAAYLVLQTDALS